MAATGSAPRPETFRPPGLLRRILITYRHLAGLLAGGLVALAAERRADPSRLGGLTGALVGMSAAVVRPFVDRQLRDQPFAVQLRRRLEMLGPTYIKLGQVLSLREDILPSAVTTELKNLFDRLPAVPFEHVAVIIERALGAPVESAFAWIDHDPIGSASIGQVHAARTRAGEDVILKIVKPGIRETLSRDATLLRFSGRVLQPVFARFQPKRIINEFVDYTMREVDLRLEADNAETFAANFADEPAIVFPQIYRALSSRDVLCMERLIGFKPSEPEAQQLSDEERDRLIDLGAEAIIRMLYRDGFFHADLHPGNLIVLSGPRCGFIDLGMVGRFGVELRRLLLYYYYSLVTGDTENAARYLAAVADPGPGADIVGFRRDVEDVSRRFARHANFREFSLARLVMTSVSRAAHYRLYFPVEMVLMVKALVTFEGVGQLLKPGFDVMSVSQRHVRQIFLDQFSPLRLAREGLRGAPELLDALAKAPLLVGEGLRVLERTTQQPSTNPLAGVRSALLAGSCLVGGVIVLTLKGPMALWIVLFVLAFVLALRRQ